MPDPTFAESPLDPVLADWMVQQRWFAGNGSTARLSLRATLEIPSSERGVRIETLFVLDDDPTAPALYQVPVVHRPSGAETYEGVIGSTGGEVLIDGPRDTAYAEALLDLVVSASALDADGDVAATGVVADWSEAPPDVAASRVLSGEQSNTSIILDLAVADRPIPPAIVKVFRALHHGENPDVVLQSAISAAGSARVPRTYGAVTGRWPDRGRLEGTATGHLAVAQEFLSGTEDAWRVALGAARDSADFTGPARALGEATAEVHRILAARLPSTSADVQAKQALLASMRSRCEQAVDLLPDLQKRSADIETVFARAAAADWPKLQRIHGDYHLGQVLLVPNRGWVLLDFEGEPLRPMTERSEPDLPLRDVAGMLRSFDYVAGTIAQEGGEAHDWAAAARAAFLDGYGAESGASLRAHAALLDALELDKALYECQYEARNRPAWLPIPRDAVSRLLERSE